MCNQIARSRNPEIPGSGELKFPMMTAQKNEILKKSDFCAVILIKNHSQKKSTSCLAF